MKKTRIPAKMVITIIAGLAVVVFVVYMAYLSHKDYEETIVSQTQQQLLMNAGSIALGIEYFIAEHSDDLKTISKTPKIQNKAHKSILVKKPPSGHCICLDLYGAHKDHVDAFTILDAKGIMLRRLPHREEAIGKDHSDKPGVAYVLREHKAHVSEVFYNNLGNLAISISEPVFYGGEFAGMVRWMIQIDTISKHFIEPIKIGRKGYAWMCDDRDTILSHPKKEFVGISVLDFMRKMHKEGGEAFDETGLEAHIREEHDYLNRVKVEEEGYGMFTGCITGKDELTAYKRVAIEDRAWHLIITLPYSEIAGPIHDHARKIFWFAGIVILVFGVGGTVLFRARKRKAELETEAKYLKQVAKSAEELKESKEKLVGIVDSVTDVMIMVDDQYNVVWNNDIAVEVFGPGVIGKKCYSVYHGHDKVCKPCIVKECFEDGKAHDFETEITGTDGNRMSFWGTASVAAWDEDGRPKMVVEFLREITDRKQAQREIETLKQQIEFILGATKTGVDIIDSGFNIRYIDPEWEKVYGDPTGRKCYEYYMDRNEVCPDCGIVKALETKEPHVTEQVLVKEGNRPIQVTTIPFQNDEGEWLVAEVNVDITERKRLEAQLQHAQKMEAIGTLAGGIAHDFNNILQAISGYTQLLLIKKVADDPDSRYLNQINKSIQRAGELTQRLLIFSRKVESKLRPIDVNQEVLQVHQLLRRTIPKMIDIQLNLAEDLKVINGDPVQLEQVIMNLGVNAMDAMPDGGKLIFETKNMVMDEEYCKSHLGAEPGSYVLLSSSDTGHGMDKETLEHIFEPFYTTKEMGKGTGLGLAMVYGIVKSHGGYITCYSEPGQGTVFKIYFPALDIEEAEQEAQPENGLEIRGGHETILFVDDEEILRNLGKNMLGQYGYTAITAESGERAIEIYKTEKGRIDLVILDVGLPGMGGRKCLEELLRIDPEIKVIIASGYASSVNVQEMIESGAAGFIGKPYHLADMLNKVRDLLDQG